MYRFVLSVIATDGIDTDRWVWEWIRDNFGDEEVANAMIEVKRNNLSAKVPFKGFETAIKIVASGVAKTLTSKKVNVPEIEGPKSTAYFYIDRTLKWVFLPYILAIYPQEGFLFRSEVLDIKETAIYSSWEGMYPEDREVLKDSFRSMLSAVNKDLRRKIARDLGIDL